MNKTNLWALSSGKKVRVGRPIPPNLRFVAACGSGKIVKIVVSDPPDSVIFFPPAYLIVSFVCRKKTKALRLVAWVLSARWSLQCVHF